MFDILSVVSVQENMPDILKQYGALNPIPVPATYIAKTRRLWNQGKRTAGTVLTGRCYSVGRVTRQGNSSLT
ncbi:hypothetical protein C3433_26610 [Citrobacter freundii]|nr:hypothetical protein C3433_26610 [Citrobacter freundii]